MAVADGFHVDSIGNLWLGSNRETFDATTRSEAPFYVYANGDMVANSGTFAGTLSSGISISAPVITGGSISGTSGSFTGSISGASGTFTGDLSGSDITGGTIDIGSGTFEVDSSGNLTATSATITGSITSTSGTIGGWTIGSTDLSAGNISIDSGGTISANYSATTGWKIEADGDAFFNDIDLRIAGAISANPTTGFTTLDIGTAKISEYDDRLWINAAEVMIWDGDSTADSTNPTLHLFGTYAQPGWYVDDGQVNRTKLYYTSGNANAFHTESDRAGIHIDSNIWFSGDSGSANEYIGKDSGGNLGWHSLPSTGGAHADSDHTSFATTTSLNNHTGNNSAHGYSAISINGLSMEHGYGITFVGGSNTSVSTTNTSPYEITISSSGGISSAVQGINGNTSSQHYFSTSGTGIFSNSDMDGSNSTHSFAFSSTMPNAGSITTGHHLPNGTKNLGGFETYWNYVYYNNLSGSSDERKKNSIEDIDVGLDFVNALQPRKFKWNVEESLECDTCTCEGEVLNATCEMENCEGTIIDASAEKADDIQYGFIAQETLTLLDEDLDYQLVQYNTERDEYTMSYTSMIAPLVKAVQELSAKNDALELRIAELEG